jgi:2-oxoglutarate ferredoxin oxidoreductase subunit alpha
MQDISIVICGEAGQGLQTVEQLFTKIVRRTNYSIFSTKEYMSRIRGGSNSTEIRIGSKPVRAFVNKIDILIPLNNNAIAHLDSRISKKTIILGERENIIIKNNCKLIEIPFSKLAKDIGNIVYSNAISIGLLSSIFSIDKKIVSDQIENFFIKKTKNVIKKNIQAANLGYDTGLNLIKKRQINQWNEPNISKNSDIILNGTEAIGLGAIAGGCNFISSYPMSPSTGVFTFLSKHSNDFNIIVEQAEDEISAINMTLGAWYAGARGMVTTSGGGFALMTEGISLAGMIESPVVIHLGQRPGPATGLPTRTEQSDLLHVLFSSHGEFPKIIFAPGTLEDGFYLTQKAFNLSDKYQIPVFILSDQYFVDSYYNIKPIKLDNIKIKNYFVKTKKDYKRYEFSKNGISPRGIPGYGNGLICIDSDEHDEEGRITENKGLRKNMVEKRLIKLKEIKKEIIPPNLIGNENYKYLIIGWGSTYHIIKEAIERLNRKDISFLHFKQVYPIHKDIKNYLNKAKKTIIIENNALSQFGMLIKLYTGIEIEHKILQYTGLAFSVEKLEKQIKRIIGR